MFIFLLAFCASLLTSAHPLLFKKDATFQTEVFMGHTDQKEFFNDRNIIIDLFILALGIKTLFFLGFHIYKECAYKNVMEGKESNNHMSLNQCGRESDGRSEGTSFEDNPVSNMNDQLEPTIPSGCSSFLETSPMPTEHSAGVVPEQIPDTVIIDGLRVPKTIVDLIDVIVLRTTSLETQLIELKEQLSSEEPQQQQQNEQQQSATMELPSYLPEDEEKRPLHTPTTYEPVRGDWAQVRENALEFLAENENSDLTSCAICVGVTLAIGFAAYKVLGR